MTLVHHQSGFVEVCSMVSSSSPLAIKMNMSRGLNCHIRIRIRIRRIQQAEAFGFGHSDDSNIRPCLAMDRLKKIDLFEEQNEGGDFRLPPGLIQPYTAYRFEPINDLTAAATALFTMANDAVSGLRT